MFKTRIPPRAMITLVILTALAFVATALGRSSVADLNRQDLWVAAALLVVILVLERLDITLPIGTENFSVSAGASMALAAAVHLGVFAGCLIVFLAHLIDSLISRRDPMKSWTNIATFVAATAVGGWVYLLVADPGMAGQTTQVLVTGDGGTRVVIASAEISPLGSLRNMGALVLASLAWVATNTIAVALIVAPVIGMRARELWRNAAKLTVVESITLPAITGLVTLAAAENAAAVLLLAFPLMGPQVAYRTLARVQQNTRDTLESLVDVLEQRDPYTANHSSRVADYSRRILKELEDLSWEETETIVTAARVHDVGKVGTRDATLYKPGALTDEEWEEFRRHPVVGEMIVSRIEEYRKTAHIVRHHHERWAGGGYPDGISGEDIPLGARVICVADSFDAMTTDRPYRKGMAFEVAFEEIRRNAGTQFDPEVAHAFLRAMGAGPSPQDIDDAAENAAAD